MTAADRLNEIEARANAATRGLWGWAVSADRRWAEVTAMPDAIAVSRSADDDDADFIAHARTDVPVLVAALRAVLRVCDATEATPVPGIVITGAHVSTTNIRRAIEEALNA